MRNWMLAMTAAVGLLGWHGHGQAQTTLRFADTLSASDTHNEAARRMAERVKELTGGAIVISVHPAGELGNDNALLEGIRLGSIDLGLTGNPFFTAFAPRLNVMDLPYLFRDPDHAHKVMDGPVGQELLKVLDMSWMKGIGFWEIGFRHITTSNRAVKTPDDLKGLKIRTTPNPVHGALHGFTNGCGRRAGEPDHEHLREPHVRSAEAPLADRTRVHRFDRRDEPRQVQRPVDRASEGAPAGRGGGWSVPT